MIGTSAKSAIVTGLIVVIGVVVAVTVVIPRLPKKV